MDEGFGVHIRRMADGVGKLVSESLALARVELARDLKAMALDVVWIVLFLGIVGVGYVLLCASVALGISRWVGLGWAFLIVAGANLAIGAVGVALAARHLGSQKSHLLETTTEEVRETAREITHAREVPVATEASCRAAAASEKERAAQRKPAPAPVAAARPIAPVPTPARVITTTTMTTTTPPRREREV
jgi:uncharacterized membrane protein YqjE